MGGALKTDKSKPRGVAIKLNGENEAWTMVMLNTEINFAKNPQEFGQFFEMNIPVNGKVDKENIAKLMKEVDSYRNFIEYNSKRGITVGTLNVSQYSGNRCNSDVYFPSEIPTGVGAPNDPLFDVRNQAYAITFGKRQ